MFNITSRLNFTRTEGSTVVLGIMLFFSLPAATYAAPTLSLTANPVKVGKGGAATLSWISKNTKSCTASAGWSGSKGTSGSQTVKNITSSQTYKLTCAGTTKNVSATVKVAVIYTSSPPPVSDGSLSGPGNCAEAQSTSDVVFCQDFDGSALGDWDLADMGKDFPGAGGFITGVVGATAGNMDDITSIVSGSNAVSGKSLRTKFLPNLLGGLHFEVPIVPHLEEAYFGYWVRFDPEFPTIKGGKILGLTGGTSDDGKTPASCRPMKKGLGFSARNMFVGGDNFTNYFYWMDNPRAPNSNGKVCGGPGPKFGNKYHWVPGQWYFIEEHVKLNSPAGAANGLFKTWINGKLFQTIANTRIRGPGANFSIESFLFHTYLGGGDSAWYSPKVTYNYIDVVVVSRNRIGGPGGG